MSSEEWAALIAAVALIISLGQWIQTHRSNRIKALLGDKETIGFEAVRIGRQGSWQQYIPGRRVSTGALRAMMLSTVFEGSDRARMQVYTALDKIRPTHGKKIIVFRDELGRTLNRYKNLTGKDGKQAIDTYSFEKRLGQLDAAIPWIAVNAS